jgi:hypothetical protein
VTPSRQHWDELDLAAMRARIAAYTLHSKYDSRALTARARNAFLARFLKEVDPDGRLPETERVRRAECARRAYFTRLALLSAKARASRRR